MLLIAEGNGSGLLVALVGLVGTAIGGYVTLKLKQLELRAAAAERRERLRDQERAALSRRIDRIDRNGDGRDGAHPCA